MEDLHVLDFVVSSHRGDYTVQFQDQFNPELGTHYIIDSNLTAGLDIPWQDNVVLIDATEDTKSYQGIEPIITELLSKNLRRDSHLVAIGGGITQDIACFIATTFMRGIAWTFVPTTVLAQADSCIGSKSSINFGRYKNLLGSFTPPDRVIINSRFIDTLADSDVKSGIGEIIKLLLISGQCPAPGEITRSNIDSYVYQALMIKKVYIEQDEFDQGIRQILNYGHCIGHGIESSTDFAIPHGIAITIGMDAVNRFAYLQGLITESQWQLTHQTLYENYQEFVDVFIDIDRVCGAMTKDKKNTGSKINLILPANLTIKKQGFENSPALWESIRSALTDLPITAR